MKGNYQTVERFQEVSMSIAADPQATLPSLIDACKKLITSDRRRVMDERGKRLASASAQALERARLECTYGWDASPITLQRLAVEVYDVIRDKEWASVGGGGGPAGEGGRVLRHDGQRQRRWRRRIAADCDRRRPGAPEARTSVRPVPG